MPHPLLRLVTTRLSSNGQTSPPAHIFSIDDVVWAMGSFCALNRKPFDAALLTQQFPPPYSADSLVHAARALGFKIKRKDCDSETLASLNLPCLAILHAPHPETAGIDPESSPSSRNARPAIVVQVNDDGVVLFEAGTNTPKTLAHDEFAAC
ncbi:MAG TPA: hypothetical protein VF427_09465 [Noviherbaspirillum sp.]